MPYTPSLHTASNKPYGLGQAGPTDARSYFYDEVTFAYRPYTSKAEVLGYLNQTRYRQGNFAIFILESGAINEYSFRNGTADNDLVPKSVDSATETTAGKVQIATDAEVQVKTAPASEDAKVVSRLKHYNWWDWIRNKADATLLPLRTITQEFAFALLKLTVPAAAGSANGHFWFDGTVLKVFKGGAAEDIITKTVNPSLSGTTERVVTAGNTGGVQAPYTLIEEWVTDGDILTALNGATYNGGNGFTAAIVPAVGKIMYKGQRAKNTTHLFTAFDDNLITRMPLG